MNKINIEEINKRETRKMEVEKVFLTFLTFLKTFQELSKENYSDFLKHAELFFGAGLALGLQNETRLNDDEAWGFSKEVEIKLKNLLADETK